MPELPEVETIVRDLRPRILGATITDAHCSWARTLRTHTPETIGSALAGRRVEAVGRRAKLLVLELSGEAILTIHLKMTGQLFVVAEDAPADPYIRLVIRLDGGRELRFRDIRKFGKVGIYPRHAGTGEPVIEVGGAAVFAGLGPEPLDDAFTLRLFRRRVRARSGRLKPLLLDQSFVAGIGNIYADEVLWAARLHPLRSASTLRPADERRLFLSIRSILAEAVERRGSSIDDYTAPDGDGSMQERLQVYQRAGQPCARCRRPVRRIVVAGRATHFCSWCQRLPVADRKGAATILRAMTPRPAGRAAGSVHGAVVGPARTAGTTARRGRRWTEMSGPAPIGLTRDEAARSALAALRERANRTKVAAATRRTQARAAAQGSGAAASAPVAAGEQPA